MKKIIAFMLILVSMPLLAALGPEELIRQTANRVIDEIKVNAQSYRSDPASLYKLVDEVVLPHFDFDSMTELALGRHKDEVSVAQKPAIVNEFKALLVRTYAAALLEYNDQEIVFLPMEGLIADGKVTVRTEIKQAGGFPIPIDYALSLGDKGWKVYDISVDEVSLVTNYRSSFSRAIKKDGIDGLIKTLKERNDRQ